MVTIVHTFISVCHLYNDQYIDGVHPSVVVTFWKVILSITVVKKMSILKESGVGERGHKYGILLGW